MTVTWPDKMTAVVDNPNTCLDFSTKGSDFSTKGTNLFQHTESVLEVNCVGKWALWVCYVGNMLGLFSTGLWFIVLVPQVAKNFWRKSVVGLSFLWGLANFTASIVNLFFIFNLSLPYYVLAEGVYMPILEITILSQFFMFHKEAFHRKLLVLVFCLLLWGTIIELQLAIPGAYEYLEWISIVLWSVETYPQVILNLNRRSTDGQSTISVLITICGKTSDFISTYGLNLPTQYVIMQYFSSTAGLINGFQLFWYGRKVWTKDGCFTCRPPNAWCRKSKTIALVPGFVERRGHEEDVEGSEADAENSTMLNADIGEGLLYFEDERQETSPINEGNSDNGSELEGDVDTIAIGNRGSKCSICRKVAINLASILGMLYCGLGICVFAVAFWWKTQSLWTIAGPVGCISTLVLAYAYRFLREKGYLGKLSCYQFLTLKCKRLWMYL